VYREAHYKAKGNPDLLQDLTQEGYTGLLGAIERFDATAGYKFSSYAVPYIRGKIQNYLRDRSQLIRIPRTIQDLQAQAGRELLKNNRQYLPDAEMARRLNITSKAWQNLKQSFYHKKTYSLDVPIASINGPFSTIAETLIAPQNDDAEEHEWIRQELISFLPQMSDRTAQVIRALYLQGKTVKDASELLGVRETTVYRHRDRGVKAFREYLLCDN